MYDDFIQNIFSVIRLRVDKFTSKKLEEKLDNFIRKMQIDDDKKANEKTIFTLLTNLLYIIVIISAIGMQSEG